MLLLYPIAVGYSQKPADSQTWLDIIFGFGTIVDVVRDCSGNVIQIDRMPYLDGAAGITYKKGAFKSSAHVGYTSLNIPEKNDSGVYFSLTGVSRSFLAAVTNAPYMNVQLGGSWETFGIDFGATVVGYRQWKFLPSCTVRLGEDQGPSFLAHCYDASLLASGTTFDAGARLPVASKLDLYLSIGLDLNLYGKLNSQFRFWNAAHTTAIVIGGGIGLDPETMPWSLNCGYKTSL